MERDTVALVSHKQHLRSESRADELAAHSTCSVLGILAALLSGDLLEHLCNSGTVLGVEVCIDFVEEVEGCGITLLNSEDECEST